MEIITLEKLREFMVIFRISNKYMSEMLGIHKTTMSLIKNNHMPISSKMNVKIVEVINSFL